jgi:hypothetical protein
MEFVSLNPKPLLVLSYVRLYMFYWWLNMVVNYCQQAPPSLTFASPLAKLNSAKSWNMSGLNAFTSQKYICIQTKILLRIRINRSNFQTYPYYLQPWDFLAFTWVLSNWRTEQSSQVLCLKLFAHPLFRSFASFQNKAQSFYCMTLSSLSIYVVFVDPYQGSSDVMPFYSYN